MAIDHLNIPEAGLHEPKGASTAPSNRAYIADGLGSGTWALVDADSLQGTVNNTTGAGQRVITDGSGGFTGESAPGYHRTAMTLTGNITAIAITAAVDSTLRTNTDYKEVILSFGFEGVEGMSSGANYMQITEPGYYMLDFWANAKASSNNAAFAAKFMVNDTTYGTRRPIIQMPTAGELHNISANGFHPFNAGDQIKLVIASDLTTNITIDDLVLQLILIGGL